MSRYARTGTHATKPALDSFSDITRDIGRRLHLVCDPIDDRPISIRRDTLAPLLKMPRVSDDPEPIGKPIQKSEQRNVRQGVRSLENRITSPRVTCAQRPPVRRPTCCRPGAV